MSEKYWDGIERRVQDHTPPTIICKQENNIKTICETIIRTEGRIEALDIRINGTLEKMSMHVEDSTYWRRFIMGVAISLVIAILGGIVTIATISYNLGEYTRQIKVNTSKIDAIEIRHANYN